MPLLMTSRRRWVAASGATVAPVRRMPAIMDKMESDKVPARSDGSDTATCSRRQRSMLWANRLSRAEKSPVDKDKNDNSS